MEELKEMKIMIIVFRTILEFHDEVMLEDLKITHS